VKYHLDFNADKPISDASISIIEETEIASCGLAASGEKMESK